MNTLVDMQALADLVVTHPPPWCEGRVRELPISQSVAYEIRDAAGELVMEASSRRAGAGFIALVNLFWEANTRGLLEASPRHPWRGQESVVEATPERSEGP